MRCKKCYFPVAKLCFLKTIMHCKYKNELLNVLYNYKPLNLFMLHNVQIKVTVLLGEFPIIRNRSIF